MFVWREGCFLYPPLRSNFQAADQRKPAAAGGRPAGVRLGGTLEMIESAVEDGLPFRDLSGYSGWSRGQLDDEIGSGSWYVLEADEAHVFADDPEALWQRLSERASAPWARRGGRADGETLVAP